MSVHEPIVRLFFDDYAARMNAALADPKKTDIAGLRAAFADYMVGANPNGVFGGRNGLLFRFVLPRGIARYRRIGTLAMDVIGLRVTDLDDFHALAHVDWCARYRGGKEISFTNVYILQMRDGAAKIFAWITGDEEAALKAHGIVD